MKKIYLVSLIAIIVGFIFTLKPDWFTFFWGWQMILLPIAAGILMVLVQKEDKSYHFLPKLVIGSIMTSFLFILIWQIIAFKPGNRLYIPETLYTALFLATIIIFGGLIGVVVKGLILLAKGRQQKNKKLKITFLTILGIVILLFCFYCPVIFQEGNPLPLFKAIIRLNISQQNIVKLDSDSEKYLTKNKNGQEILANKLEENNYRFIEQLGSGYLFRNDNLDILVATKKQYSRFYFIWTIGEPRNVRDSIEWIKYKNEEYNFSFNYPITSINNKWWGNISEEKAILNLLLPNQVLNKNNNFYLTQKYNVEVDLQTGELIKIENTFVPEYKENDNSYPLPWHIVIFDTEVESDLDSLIKDKLGAGCRYKGKTDTSFEGNYRVEINGDGKDLGETLCPVNYANYIVYSPIAKKVAFWSLGQECNVGLGFTAGNCFDLKIADSFHFFN